MERVLVFNSQDEFLFEINPGDIFEARMTESITGENALDITTTQRLSQSQRLVLKDGQGIWREYVVYGVDENHDSGASAIGSYHAVWSCQYDLSTVYGEDIEVGGETPANATTALTAALNGTRRWAKGTVSASGTATIEMFGNSAWERICQCVESYQGEIYPTITVGVNKVTGRKLNFVGAMGSSKVTRRFDWGHDLTQIRRKPKEAPLCCRIIPIGSSDEVRIDDVNGGVPYVRDTQAEQAYRMPDGQGGWEYPTCIVRNEAIDDDRILLNWARNHVTEYTRPSPTYDASVVQYAAAGMDVKGVALGDVVHVVDRGFNPDAPLTIEARVVSKTTNLLDLEDMQLTIGQLGDSLSATFSKLNTMLGAMRSKLDAIFHGSKAKPTTAQYLEYLIGELNKEINATGGYAYIVPGEGIVTYDVPVADPLVATEANQVTQIKGGSIRIANVKNPGFAGINDWDWKTVIVSGHIAAEVVTAANLVAGSIRSADSESWWDLDSDELVTHDMTAHNMTATGSFTSTEGQDSSYISTRIQGASFESTDQYGTIRIRGTSMLALGQYNLSSKRTAASSNGINASFSRDTNNHEIMILQLDEGSTHQYMTWTKDTFEMYQGGSAFHMDNSNSGEAFIRHGNHYLGIDSRGPYFVYNNSKYYLYEWVVNS